MFVLWQGKTRNISIVRTDPVFYPDAFFTKGVTSCVVVKCLTLQLFGRRLALLSARSLSFLCDVSISRGDSVSLICYTL
jgi:hypothetical protein